MTRYRDRLNAGEFKPKPKTKTETPKTSATPDASWTDRPKLTSSKRDDEVTLRNLPAAKRKP